MTWHEEIDRGLPWKETNDPYRIWISEIILQQTRVAQGRAYYERMIDHFPTVRDLADASEDQVLSIWKGLGYYARARNLHYASKQIIDEFNGVFPTTYNDLRLLKGVGLYTAAAIASFAYNLPYAVLDGNVFRVLSRFFGLDTPIDSTIGKKLFSEQAQRCLDKSDPAGFNQAIMDFGALQCTAQSPSCDICPLKENCVAFNENIIDLLPTKSKKIKVRSRYFHYLVIPKGNQICLIKRKDRDIWQGLYELPLIESEKSISTSQFIDLFQETFSINMVDKRSIKKISTKKQRLTHQMIYGNFYIINMDLSIKTARWKSKEELKHLGVPKIVDDFLKEWLQE